MTDPLTSVDTQPQARAGTESLNGRPEALSNKSFAAGARILSIGIASTGIFTFLYLATASHVLDPASYSRISLCWAVMFVILSVIYRPIEQLLSRMTGSSRECSTARPRCTGSL
ncbi:MAG: hypothetical protein E6G05_05255 [Actinobacteria bacterium]|nr:MAG: hypothetical protein E6G05_05255 [Actinomycetota bacterium]